MIYVDANVFLRFFVVARTLQDRMMGRQASDLFERVRAGDVQMTTSDAVVAEVLFIMTSNTHYGLQRAEAAGRLVSILSLDGMKLSTKRACLTALNTWVAHPRLSYPDALSAAIATEMGYELASFDLRLTRLPKIRLYEFPDVDGESDSE